VDPGFDAGFTASMIRQTAAWDGPARQGLAAVRLGYMLSVADHQRDAAYLWERTTADLLVASGGRAWSLWKIRWFSETVFGDDLTNGIQSDVTLVVIGYCIMSTYASLFMGSRWNSCKIAVSLLVLRCFQ